MMKQMVSKNQEVDNMTAIDFQNDPQAHLENIKFDVKNKQRLQLYEEAIMENQHLFIGKTVLDVECGVGLLSLLVARAGASKVYAVQNSNVTDYARRIIQKNKKEAIIEVIKSSIDELELPTKVDIIVSDWMGCGFIFQSSADSVIKARDKFLKPNGLIIPSKVHIYMMALENTKYHQNNFDCWNSIYGFKMHRIADWAITEPVHQRVHPSMIVSSEFRVGTIDLHKAHIEDLILKTKFKIMVNRGCRVDAFATYFEIIFKNLHDPIRYSTSPFDEQTGWAHQVFNIDEPFICQANDRLYGGIQIGSYEEPYDKNKMFAGIDVFNGPPAESPLVACMRYMLDAGI